MIQDRNRNFLLSLAAPFPKGESHYIADTKGSSALASRDRLEERIEWALKNTMDSTADHPEAAERVQVMLSDSSEVTNLRFEARVNGVIPASARVNAFYAKVAGASYTNANGTSHAAVIEKCKTFDVLRLETKLGNPFNPHAVAVFSEAGEQIGYLDSRLTNGAEWNGKRWMAIFRHKNRHPETGAVIGAVVYMIYLTEPFAREHSRRIAREQGAAFQPSGLERCIDGS